MNIHTHRSWCLRYTYTHHHHLYHQAVARVCGGKGGGGTQRLTGKYICISAYNVVCVLARVEAAGERKERGNQTSQ